MAEVFCKDRPYLLGRPLAIFIRNNVLFCHVVNLNTELWRFSDHQLIISLKETHGITNTLAVFSLVSLFRFRKVKEIIHKKINLIDRYRRKAVFLLRLNNDQIQLSDRFGVNLRLFLYEASIYKEVHSVYPAILVTSDKARKDFFIGNTESLEEVFRTVILKSVHILEAPHTTGLPLRKVCT